MSKFLSGGGGGGAPAAHGSTHTDGTDNVADLVGDSGAGGTHGLVPAPAAGDAAAGKFLKADGVWTFISGGTVQGTNGTYDIRANNQGATIGNARGEYSVDLQTIRNSASQVAASTGGSILGGRRNLLAVGATYSVIAGGIDNTIPASGGDSGTSAIGGGNSNTIFNGSGISVIAGGDNNTIQNSAGRAFIGGGKDNLLNSALYGGIASGLGNSAYTDYSCVLGGQSNQVTTGSHGTIAGGLNNSVTGQYALASGLNTVASGQASVALGNGNVAQGIASAGLNRDNVAAGDYSLATGYLTTANGTYSHTSGYYATTSLYGGRAHSAGRFAVQGDAQYTRAVSRNSVADDTPTEIYLDGSGVRLTVPSGKTISFLITVTATQTGGTAGDVGDSKIWKLFGGIKNIAGATTLIGSVDTVSIGDTAAAAWTMTATADDANDSLKLEFTGENLKNIRIVATEHMTEASHV